MSNSSMFRFAVLLLFFSPICYACDCSRRPDCGGFSHNESYFAGTPYGGRIQGNDFSDTRRYFIAIPLSRRVVQGQQTEEPVAVYKVRVTESFSSAISSEEVEVRTGTGGADCSWHFRFNKPYFIEASQTATGLLFTSSCTFTGELEQREAIVRSLRSFKSGQRPASLLATLTQEDFTVDPPSNKAERPLADVTVTAQSQSGKIWKSTSDKRGVVTFEVLPPGDYVLSPEFSVGLILYRGQNIGYDFSKVTIPANTGSDPPFCRAYLEAISSAGITGRVVASKRELQNSVVTAWLLQNGKKREIRVDFPENGAFELRHLPPGTYLLTFGSNYGRDKFPAYTQTVVVRNALTTEVILSRKKDQIVFWKLRIKDFLNRTHPEELKEPKESFLSSVIPRPHSPHCTRPRFHRLRRPLPQVSLHHLLCLIPQRSLLQREQSKPLDRRAPHHIALIFGQ